MSHRYCLTVLQFQLLRVPILESVCMLTTPPGFSLFIFFYCELTLVILFPFQWSVCPWLCKCSLETHLCFCWTSVFHSSWIFFVLNLQFRSSILYGCYKFRLYTHMWLRLRVLITLVWLFSFSLPVNGFFAAVPKELCVCVCTCVHVCACVCMCVCTHVILYRWRSPSRILLKSGSTLAPYHPQAKVKSGVDNWTLVPGPGASRHGIGILGLLHLGFCFPFLVPFPCCFWHMCSIWSVF
jgi:hypothetical protein